MASPLHKFTSAAAVSLAAAQTALPFPPVAASLGLVPAAWGTADGVVPEFDLRLRAASAVTLTSPTLYAASEHAFTYADNDITTVTHGSDLFTKVAHGLLHGDGPIQFTNAGGALPAGMSLLTDYWVVYVDADTFKIATTQALALEGTVVNLTGNGTGTHTVVDTADTKRVHWHSVGVIEASMSLGPQLAYSVVVDHDPLTLAYAVGATLSGAVATTVEIVPRRDR